MIASIARELGAGGRTVGEAVARALNAPLLDERTFIAELSRRSTVRPRTRVRRGTHRATA